MTARPPPARPHIGLNPSSHFSHSNTEWGEDDAWDSASDSESPSPAPPLWNRSASSTSARPITASTAPKPVPRTSRNDSSSTLAFSYTHVSAPSPSSYPSKSEQVIPSKNGWTLVQKSEKEQTSVSEKEEVTESDRSADVDVEGDMIVGDMDPEFAETFVSTKSRQKPNTIREDAQEIVNGTSTRYSYRFQTLIQCLDPLHLVRRRTSKRPNAGSRSRSHSPAHGARSPERLIREHSIRTNRRHKFIECLMREDVDMGMSSPHCLSAREA